MANQQIKQDISPAPPHNIWHYTVGTGRVHEQHGFTRLVISAQSGTLYNDAQVDDYSRDGVLRWKPPVRLALRCRASHSASLLRGTCGFGFWNDPLGMTNIPSHRQWWARVRLPQAVWFFFAAPPSNMPWAWGVPGTGWKAATLDASRWAARVLLPFAPFGMLICRWSPACAMLWPWLQRLLRIDERLITVALDEWHDYCLEWEANEVRFRVDNAEILRTPHSPRGPLGLVIWIDNQFMIATPQGIIRQGIVATEEQWLEVESIQLGAM